MLRLLSLSVGADLRVGSLTRSWLCWEAGCGLRTSSARPRPADWWGRGAGWAGPAWWRSEPTLFLYHDVTRSDTRSDTSSLSPVCASLHVDPVPVSLILLVTAGCQTEEWRSASTNKLVHSQPARQAGSFLSSPAITACCHRGSVTRAPSLSQSGINFIRNDSTSPSGVNIDTNSEHREIVGFQFSVLRIFLLSEITGGPTCISALSKQPESVRLRWI